jgi:hypothetical protein
MRQGQEARPAERPNLVNDGRAGEGVFGPYPSTSVGWGEYANSLVALIVALSSCVVSRSPWGPSA